MKVKCSKKFTKKFMKMGFGNDNGEEILSSEFFYDEKGNLIKDLKYDNETGICEENTYEYDEKGQLLKHHLEVEADGISETLTFNRDEKGRLVTELKIYGDDPGERIELTYSSHDNPITINRYDSDGEHETEETLEYDDSDRVVKHTRKNIIEKDLEISFIKYNEQDLPVKKEVKNADDKLILDVTLQYDDKGRMIRETEKNEGGKAITDIVSIYDEKDNVIERRIKDYHTRILKFHYDENDNCTEEAILDEHGNLTMKTIIEFNEHNLPLTESGYYTDTNRSQQLSNNTSRFEYEFYE